LAQNSRHIPLILGREFRLEDRKIEEWNEPDKTGEVRETVCLRAIQSVIPDPTANGLNKM
jgi:hypothetical protein